MKKLLVSQVSAVLFVALLVLGLACPVPAQSVKARELTLSTYTPSTHHVAKVLTDFGNELEKATGGQIKIVLYPSGTLTKAELILDGVIKGISDFGFSVNGYNPGRLPLMEVTDLPIAVATSEKMSQVCLALYKKFQPKEFSQLKVLSFLNMAGSGISSNKPINKFADMAGQLIRCTGADVELVKTLGATPVAMPISQAYEALQRGVADGNLGDFASLMSYKLGEVVKIHVEYFFRNTTCWYGMNLKTYDSLTPAQQKIITDLGEKYTTILGQSRDAENKKAREYLTGLGNKLVKLPVEEEQKWAAALLSLYDKYLKDKTAKGLPAKEALDFVLAAVK
ncbi:MAG: TRAP transporter substrate-binding protein [Thermodesulfobacteriota bacterium]|nr:TRAP transporter substrate-binding protein [Thermodesulfobacteriota bacterium]